MTAVGTAEEAFYSRASGDSALTGALGDPSYVVQGWPADVLASPAASSFPRLTFFGAVTAAEWKGYAEVEIQADIWIWPGQEAALETIDGRLEALFKEQHWTYSGSSLAGIDWQGANFPAGPNEPRRRMRRIRLMVT